MHFRILFLSVIFGLCPINGYTAEIYVEAPPHRSPFIVIEGSIREGDAAKFDELLRQPNRPHTVALSSNGGDVREALLIAERIHFLSLVTRLAHMEGTHTYSVKGSEDWHSHSHQYRLKAPLGCHSSCAFIFFAGAERIYEYGLNINKPFKELPPLTSAQLSGAPVHALTISVHRPFLAKSDAMNVTQKEFAEGYREITRLIEIGLKLFEVPDGLTRKLLDTPSETEYQLLANDPLMPSRLRPSWAEFLRAKCGSNGITRNGEHRSESILVEGHQRFRSQNSLPAREFSDSEAELAKALYLRSVLGGWYGDEISRAEGIQECRDRLARGIRNANF